MGNRETERERERERERQRERQREREREKENSHISYSVQYILGQLATHVERIGHKTLATRRTGAACSACSHALHCRTCLPVSERE